MKVPVAIAGVTIIVILLSPTAFADNDPDCANYSGQVNTAYGDPNNLDADNDGVGCEANPAGGSVSRLSGGDAPAPSQSGPENGARYIAEMIMGFALLASPFVLFVLIRNWAWRRKLAALKKAG